MNKKYAIGVDFGTQSGRAVLVEIGTGKEIATAIKVYPHGVMDEYLPDGVTRLEPDFCLTTPSGLPGCTQRNHTCRPGGIEGFCP